ncbi:unnamed protein product [Vitrella brassicaformis CCMP3155]|uniref:Vacuolar protein sorting-associated protein 54 n=3 Tax=Vitrella brassicaformis TaxID=1169539 RepID=A0A0G4G5I2_VITBC|nr:unnamed protein product [Vitrella brassicaformis CCMP3155]|eukprot:CEM23723.1 unnamed protein product [Vitrella brassicaformis CCMP3155]
MEGTRAAPETRRQHSQPMAADGPSPSSPRSPRRAGSSAAASAASARPPNDYSDVYRELRTTQSLSSVLNNPESESLWSEVVEALTIRGEREAPPPPLSPIPEVKAEDFRPYLDGIRQQLREHAHRGERRRGSDAAGGDRGSLHRVQDFSRCFRIVPQMYFQSDFQLAKHQIFRQSLHTSMAMQEKLSNYLDVVEVSLFDQIRSRFQSFFSALNNLESVQEDLRSAVDSLRSLRGDLASLRERDVAPGLEVLRLTEKKGRLLELVRLMELLSSIRQTHPSLQMLLSVQDFSTAVDLIESTQKVLTTQLSRVHATKHVSAQLSDLLSSIDRMLEADFVTSAIEILLSPSPLPSEGTPRWAYGWQSASPADTLTDTVSHQHAKIDTLVGTLLRRQLLQQAVHSLRDVLLKQTKKALRVVASAEAVLAAGESRKRADEAIAAQTDGDENEPDEESEASGGKDRVLLGDQVEQLSHDVFCVFWRAILGFCLTVGRRVQVLSLLILHAINRQLAQAAADGQSPQQQQQQQQQQEGEGGAPSTPVHTREQLVTVAADLVRLAEVTLSTLLAKSGVLLQSRSDLHYALSPALFQPIYVTAIGALDTATRLHDETRERVAQAVGSQEGGGLQPALAGAMGGTVRAILYQQAKGIIEEFHQSKVAQVNVILENERWERADVQDDFVKSVVRRLVPADDAAMENGSVAANGTPAQTSAKSLVIDGASYPVVASCLVLLQVCHEYVDVCERLPVVGLEVVQRLCHTVKLFNRQTLALVLGGQAATTKKSLKKITALNLALTAQTLGCIAAVLPRLHERLTKTVASTSTTTSAMQEAGPSLLSELHQINGEFLEHRSKVFQKLGDILTERYTFHAQKWFSWPHARDSDRDESEDDDEESESEADREGEGGEPGDITASDEGKVMPPHEAVAAFAKDVNALYKVLVKVLDPEHTKKIFARSFHDISERFDRHLSGQQPSPLPSPSGTQQQQQQQAQSPQPPSAVPNLPSPPERYAFDVVYLYQTLSPLSLIYGPLCGFVGDLIGAIKAHLGLTGKALKAVEGKIPR